jgi:hypothetical protein
MSNYWERGDHDDQLVDGIGSTRTCQGRESCDASTTQRPGSAARRTLTAASIIVRKSVSVNPRSTIRLSKCGLNSSSQSHQSGQLVTSAILRDLRHDPS